MAFDFTIAKPPAKPAKFQLKVALTEPQTFGEIADFLATRVQGYRAQGSPNKLRLVCFLRSIYLTVHTNYMPKTVAAYGDYGAVQRKFGDAAKDCALSDETVRRLVELPAVESQLLRDWIEGHAFDAPSKELTAEIEKRRKKK